eukprot:2985437-Amphidinium_carterae.1
MGHQCVDCPKVNASTKEQHRLQPHQLPGHGYQPWGLLVIDNDYTQLMFMEDALLQLGSNPECPDR